MGHGRSHQVHVVSGTLPLPARALAYPSFIDPTLELDVYADKPWALSPVLSTMNYLSLKKNGTEFKGAPGEFTSNIFKPVDEDALGLVGKADAAGDVSQRRHYFADPGHRESLTLDKDIEVGMEFSNGILGASEPPGTS